MTVVELASVSKRYRRGSETVHALEGASVTVGAGELVGLVGPSGSGKTTLLNLVCGWETPDAGEIRRAHRRRTTGPSSPSCPRRSGWWRS